MLDRETRQVRAQVVPNVKRETLQKAILDKVGFGSTVYTDGWPGYDGLKAAGFVHETVNHMKRVRSRSGLHSGHRELLVTSEARSKRHLRYREPYHMDRYLDEQMFRFNNRIGHTDFNPFYQSPFASRKPSPHLRRTYGEGGARAQA